MNERKFFQSAAVLTITNGLLRLTDIWYRGYLCTHLGTAAMGLYQLNLSVFVLGVSLSAAGASFCTTRMVAEHGNDRRIIRKCLCFSLLISCSACLLFELLAPLFGPLLSGSLPLRILAVGLPFISVCACLKGCFLAEGKSGVPAVAEVVEQGATIGLGILFLDDFSSSITAVMTASTTAEAVGCTFMIFCYLKKMPHHKTCAAPIPSFCQIAAIGLPGSRTSQLPVFGRKSADSERPFLFLLQRRSAFPIWASTRDDDAHFGLSVYHFVLCNSPAHSGTCPFQFAWTAKKDSSNHNKGFLPDQLFFVYLRCIDGCFFAAALSAVL